MNSAAVIMSIYRSDCPNYLDLAMRSIIEQEGGPFDLFLYVDGVITSQLESVLGSVCHSDSVHIYRGDQNKGLAFGLNYLIEIIINQYDFKYIARMDSDDISYSRRIAKQILFLEQNPSIDVCGTFCREIGATFALMEKKLPVKHESLVDFSVARCPFIHPTVMFRSSVFRDGIRYPIDTTLTEDMALWFLLLSNGYKFQNIEEILLDYRLSEETLLRRRGLKKALSEFQTRFKYMLILRKLNLKNIFLVSGRLVFHALPHSFLKYLYRKHRC